MQITVNTMKQASHYLLLCILVSIGLSSCHKDIDEANDTTTTPITTTDVKNLTPSDVVGYIYDENNEAMADVEVTLIGNSTRTNEFGVFVFRNTNVDPNGTYITATKSGYILGSDRIYPDKADVNHSYIKMMQLTTSTTVNGANGGNIVVQGGGIISFEANSIVNSDGALHAGTVTVTAKRIATDDPDLADVMPGGLLAEDKEGYTRVLGTLGMVAVELRDASGNELNLADGSQATVQFPIAENQRSAAPDQIALWSFDEAKGLWIEEGFATRQGDNYIGQVSHFSFWNCDAPFPLIHVCGTVLNGDGTPAANISVEVMADVVFATGYGSTDSDGRFCGKMPKGEELTITIYYPGCNESGFTITVGPFDTDTELDVITLPNENNGFITGTVFCDDDIVVDASVVVNVNGQTLVYLTDSEGNYSFNTAIFGCEEIEFGSIFAFNNETNEASNTQEFAIYTDASIDLNTCGGCEMVIESNIGWTEDPCSAQSYFAIADVSGANGMVTYEWNNGSTTQVNNDLSFGLQCVTVTDNEGCQEISCIDFEFFALGDSIVLMNSSCDLNNGSILSNPFGGTAPYSFEISGPSGDVTTQPLVEDLMPGTYLVSVTDANACNIVTTVVVEDTGGIPEFDILQECNQTQLFLSGNSGVHTILFEGVEYIDFVTVFLSGDYCFEITNDLGCTETRCFFVEVFEQVPFTSSISCDFPNYNVDWGTDAFSASYSTPTGNVPFIANTTFFAVNPLQYGYTGTLVIDQDFQMCEYEEFITLPNFAGLQATGESPSCDDCEDGYIEVILDPDAACFECVAGQVSIFSLVNNDFQDLDNLTQINDAQALPSGQYYAVVTDQNTGCIIAHQRIDL